MHRFRRFRPSPSTAIALLALFFALGGSAFAVTAAVAPQARCADGAVRAVAVVTGEPNKGMANLPDAFTPNPAAFAKKFNCSGGAVHVRRLNVGIYEVRFVGNAAGAAVVSAAASKSFGAVQALGGGTFRVGVYPSTADQAAVDAPFVLVAF
jgi:hypothetical protein